MTFRSLASVGLAAVLGLSALTAGPSPSGGGGGVPPASPVRRDALEVVFFDVGDGDCAVVLTPPPGRKVLVIDGGDRRAALESVVPYLQQHGIEAIDLMILTHAAAGHIGGLRVLLDGFVVREVWDPGYSGEGAFEHHAFAAQALAAARTGYHSRLEDQLVDHPSSNLDDPASRRIVLGIPVQFGTAELTLLHTDDFLDGPTNRIDLCSSCIVVKVSHGDNSILFANGAGLLPRQSPRDAKAYLTEAALLSLERADRGLLRSTVLKVADHGSNTASGGRLLDAVQPQWAVISCVAGKRGFPHSKALGRLAERHINLLRTDAGDRRATPLDDHILLRMGRRSGDLSWHQGDTDQLLGWVADQAASSTPTRPAATPRAEQLLRPRPRR